jgi:peptide deformylase
VSLLDIQVLGAPILRQETTTVAEVTDDLRRLIDDMFETMYVAQGIGLAAPQVGRSERIAVVDVEGQKYALVNPQVVLREGSIRREEGCLSIPEVFGDVTRSNRVIVEALDRDGRPFEVDATELLAICLQHEIDHLHGRLFIDHLSILKRRAALGKWEKLKKDYPTFVRKLPPSEVAQHHKAGDETL